MDAAAARSAAGAEQRAAAGRGAPPEGLVAPVLPAAVRLVHGAVHESLAGRRPRSALHLGEDDAQRDLDAPTRRRRPGLRSWAREVARAGDPAPAARRGRTCAGHVRTGQRRVPAVRGGHGDRAAAPARARPEHRVQTLPNSSIAVFPERVGPFVAVITPSCSALSALLAVAALSWFVPRGSIPRWIAALGCAWPARGGTCCGSSARSAVGLSYGRASLVLFHDWVGSLFAFGYTLGGFLLPAVPPAPRGHGRAAESPCSCLLPDRRDVRRALAGRCARLAGGAPGPTARPVGRRAEDPDPQRRRAAVMVATEQGLRVNAALLIGHVEREREPAVLAALARACCGTRGSPPTSRRPAAAAVGARAARGDRRAGPADGRHRIGRAAPAGRPFVGPRRRCAGIRPGSAACPMPHAGQPSMARLAPGVPGPGSLLPRRTTGRHRPGNPRRLPHRDGTINYDDDQSAPTTGRAARPAWR